MKRGVLIFWVILIALIVVGVGAALLSGSTPGKYDGFAQCLEEKEVIFYGAFWCPHCQNTKAMFGKSARLLPYVECSTPDGKGQTQECKDKGISNYPTWERPDGERITGERTVQELSEFSGCSLPQ
ncbi:MAG: protein disulfide isomerase family protein [bacterium]|nr:protein disulfide isomerase family protein [bacterium]